MPISPDPPPAVLGVRPRVLSRREGGAQRAGSLGSHRERGTQRSFSSEE